MSEEKNLKVLNVKSLWLYLLFNLFVIVTFFFAERISEGFSNYEKFISLRLGGVLIAPLIIFIINGILTSNQKAVLAFWKLDNVLPGHRAFTKHGPKDYRVDMNSLTQKYGILPVNSKEQNVLWYKMFKKNREDVAIIKSHRDFLLARDMNAISLLLLVIAGGTFLFAGQFPYNIYYMLFLFFQYLLTSILTQNYGCRLVTNVLAIESTS